MHGRTALTEGNTYGFPFSSRYAPTPRLIFRGSLSVLKASVTPYGTRQYSLFCQTQGLPRIGSGGPAGTALHADIVRKFGARLFLLTARRASIVKPVGGGNNNESEQVSYTGLTSFFSGSGNVTRIQISRHCIDSPLMSEQPEQS